MNAFPGKLKERKKPIRLTAVRNQAKGIYAAICEALNRTIKGLDAAEAYWNGTYGALLSAGGWA